MMTILEAMKERRSVRGYDGKGLTPGQVEAMQRAIDGSWSPFGGKLTIKLKRFDLKAGFRPTTYGMIKGAVDFFMLGMADDEATALTAGFQFEQVVLKAWQDGLGTCWIAATFRGSDFEKGVTWPEGEELKIVSPVGVAVQPSIREKLIRFSVGSKNRLPFDKLFFYGDFTRPVPADNRFHEALEMLRLAPSSTNSQPWRALVEGDSVHFYYKPKSSYALIDTGIGICHFYETEKFYGREGRFEKISTIPSAPDNWKYAVSYFAEKQR